ncbi:MAG: VWA domain-containing protein [Chitinispirillaceae bacterium]|nr:VWA domain-containing protein [Chitinispirillaceae bacterium]
MVLLLSFVMSSLSARMVGKFSNRATPESLSTTITVSDSMVAMAEQVYVSNTIYTDSIVDTPAICFVIDHSTSMSYQAGINDPHGYRFQVTSALMDTIFLKFPTAEIGYVVFKNGLHFLYNDHPDIFGQYQGTARNDGFMSLKILNQLYGSVYGLDLLRAYLQVADTLSPNGLPYKELLNRPSTWPQEGTNITLAFEAAKQLLKASARQNASKYIIFLSDGEHTAGGDAYTRGDSCPTTFTLFFTSTGTTPANLVTMTNNIRTNNFSLTNPKSNIWPFQVTNFDALMSFVRDSIYASIGIPRPSYPKAITVSSQTIPNWDSTSRSFTFPSVFPLIGDITPFNYLIRYPRPAGDTIHDISFEVQRQAGLGNWRSPYQVWLWDRDIAVQDTNGADLTTINETHTSIVLRFEFDPMTALYNYTDISIELLNTNSSVRDREVIKCARGTGNFFTGRVNRAVAASANPMNQVLEHAASDTLVAVFRNNEAPKLPLDTIRITVPIRIIPDAIMDSAITRDDDGNGFIDRIELHLDREASIPSGATGNFVVRFGSTTLTVTSVAPVQGGNNRIYNLAIAEPTGAALQTSPLQTSWTPTVTTNLINRVTNMTITCKDGCAPVIYRIIKLVVDANDRTKDTVRVMFSEKIKNPSGGLFPISNNPSATFRVWVGNTDVSEDQLIQGISGFTRIVNDSILYFSMSNNQDLTSRNWMNVNASSLLLRDTRGNFPKANNRKVQVEVETITIIRTIPNPAIATKITIGGTNIGIEVIRPNDTSRIRDIVGPNGTIISIKGIKIPPTGKVDLTVKVYDVAGNSVAWLKKEDVLSLLRPEDRQPGAGINLFWNGINQKGMRVAPGVYRAVVYIDYPPESKIKDIRTVSIIGFQG